VRVGVGGRARVRGKDEEMAIHRSIHSLKRRGREGERERGREGEREFSPTTGSHLSAFPSNHQSRRTKLPRPPPQWRQTVGVMPTAETMTRTMTTSLASGSI